MNKRAKNNMPLDDFVHEGLKLMRQCPLCKKEYKKEEIKIIENRDKINLIYIRCEACENSVLALVIISAMGVSSVGMMTDLSSGDVKKFSGKQPFTEDDLLNFHKILTNKQKSFIQSIIDR